MSLKDSQPQAYEKGWVEFYKLKFKVTPDVLIPRPETELLVDGVLNILRESEANREDSIKTIIDIGTGCGNIAISIAKNLNLHPKGAKLNLIATDISSKALNVARQNAKLHGLDDKIALIQSDLLDVIARSEATKQSIKRIATGPTDPRNDAGIDIIVTNLPYIPTQRIPYLDSSVKDFEPHIALDGGKDGFELYRKLFKQISKLHTGFGIETTHRVWKPKLMICEIDYTHGELAVNEALKFFPDAKIEVKTDLAQKQRILKVQFI